MLVFSVDNLVDDDAVAVQSPGDARACRGAVSVL